VYRARSSASGAWWCRQRFETEARDAEQLSCFGAVAAASPSVSVGLVLAGEICTMLLPARIGATVWATEEFRVPTTPTTVGSDASLVAAWPPICAVAWSSSGWKASL